MCRHRLIGCFVLVLVIHVFEIEAWGKTFPEGSAMASLSIVAEEGGDESNTQAQKSDEEYLDTDEYEEEGIMEEEFPEDELEEEETDRENTREVVPKEKE